MKDLNKITAIPMTRPVIKTDADLVKSQIACLTYERAPEGRIKGVSKNHHGHDLYQALRKLEAEVMAHHTKKTCADILKTLIAESVVNYEQDESRWDYIYCLMVSACPSGSTGEITRHTIDAIEIASMRM